MADCANCGGCSSCSGCSQSLELSQGELDLLRALGQFSFLPVARKADDMTPIYKEDQTNTAEEYSLFITLLEKKQLIYLDYTPLHGADMTAYAGYPVHGSMGLTARGQAVLDLLDFQGISE